MTNSIFKNLTVIDNALEDPYEVVSKSRDINYYSNESNPLTGFNLSVDDSKPTGIWGGYRSEALQQVDPLLFEKIINELLEKVLAVRNFRYVVSAHLHFGDQSIIDCEKLWHTNSNSLFAGVLYLNNTQQPNSGTVFNINNELVTVENKFNRFVFYNAGIQHRPEGFFGNSIRDSRLTLSIFVERLQLGV
jgi:hypothetical protein